MKQGQFSQEQIVAILHQAERGEKLIKEICREHNITETTFYRWRKIYAGMSVSEAHRLKELETRLTTDELVLLLHADSDAIGPFDATIRAIRELVGAGLVHRDGCFLAPSRAALYFAALEAAVSTLGDVLGGNERAPRNRAHGDANRNRRAPPT